MNKISGNVPYPSWNSGWAGGEVSICWKVCGKEAGGRGGAGTFIASLAHTQVVTFAGSVVSDPSLGCSSLLKKILYYNNNMNISLFFLFFVFVFSISFRDWGMGEERKKKCHSSVRS